MTDSLTSEEDGGSSSEDSDVTEPPNPPRTFAEATARWAYPDDPVWGRYAEKMRKKDRARARAEERAEARAEARRSSEAMARLNAAHMGDS